MENKKLSHILISALLLLSGGWVAESQVEESKGKWHILLNHTGVLAMHMALTHHNNVVIFDQQGSDRSRYQLRRRYNGTRCKATHNDMADSSCYAHSVEYSISSNQIRPLNLETDAWCSSGSMLSNGTLLQTGGFGSGFRGIRYYEPCGDRNCDWRESRTSLFSDRWYSSNLLLPENDRVIVVGGRAEFTYEFVPKSLSREKSFDLPFLHDTYDRKERGNNLYPFLHLSSDGNLFIFANKDSILFNYKRNEVVKNFPRIPGNGSRNYPSTGSSVILPLDHHNGFQKVEVMVCGGSASGAYIAARNGRFLDGLRSCGRMVISGDKHNWTMENMPRPRLMTDMLILPTGNIMIINGVERGCAGWNNADNPSLEPYLYKPRKTPGSRFSVLSSTNIPRMYHSSAILLPDGRVLVAGSNPNARYMTEGARYPTELRLQAFVPPHMDEKFNQRRARNLSILYANGNDGVKYGEEFMIHFNLDKKLSNVRFSAYLPPFNTHSLSMNQRMLVLRCKNATRAHEGLFYATLEAPPSPNVAPAGYYLVTVVNAGYPSVSQWVRFMHA